VSPAQPAGSSEFGLGVLAVNLGALEPDLTAGTKWAVKGP